jgi:hypothetical protein
MLVAELFEETRDEYFTRLTKALKIKKLGSGMYATVFQHPVYTNVAVKYVGSDDEMYMKYIRIVSKTPGNPWLPRVLSIHRLTMDEADRWGDEDKAEDYLIFFEKLKPASKASIAKATKQIMNTLVWPKEEDDVNDDLVYLKGMARHPLSDWYSSDWSLVHKYTTDPKIKQCTKILMDVDVNDIHSGNVMMRGTSSCSRTQ